MSKTAVLTASGVVKAGSGEIFSIHIGKIATGSGSVTVYDNPSAASGTILWQGDGLASGAYPLGNFQGTGATAANGIYVALAGTTNATVVVVYE